MFKGIPYNPDLAGGARPQRHLACAQAASASYAS
jgi:hypothetical protein